MARLRIGSPDRICLHHAAVQGVPADLTALKKRLAGYEITHSKKTWAETIKTPGEYGYNYIEYHIAIAGNGHELRLQDDKYVLYHAGDNAKGKESFNLHGIAVLIDGNYEIDQPNDNQLEAFARIIARFEKQYKVDVIVRGHKETSLSATACPGKNLGTHTQGFLKNAIARANEILKNNLPTNPLQDDPQGPVIAPELTECQNEVKRLKEEIKARETDLTASQGLLMIKEREYGELESDYSRVKEERDRFESQYMDVTKELNELKEGRDSILKKIGDVIYKLFKGIN